MTPEQMLDVFANTKGGDQMAYMIAVGEAIAAAARAEAIEECCAAIKAEDDRASDEDYMLDSDDCIAVCRALLNTGEKT